MTSLVTGVKCTIFFSLGTPAVDSYINVGTSVCLVGPSGPAAWPLFPASSLDVFVQLFP